MADAKKIMAREAGAEASRNRFSPFTTGAALAGGVAALATGGVGPALGGLALAAGRKAYQEYGEATLARLASAAAKSETSIASSAKNYVAQITGDAVRGRHVAAAVAEAERQQNRIDRALRRKDGESRSAAYERRLKGLADADPSRMPDLGIVSDAASATAAAVVAKMSSARSWLAQAAPTGLVPDDPLQPHIRGLQPDPVALERWARSLDAMEDPLGVISDGLLTGNLTLDHTKVLEAIYPGLWQSLQRQVQEAVMTSNVPVPWEARVRLSILFAQELDHSMRPNRMARVQAAFGPQAQQEGPQQGPPPKRAQVDRAAQYKTPQQRLAEAIGEI